jgi:hypothetical protein
MIPKDEKPALGKWIMPREKLTLMPRADCGGYG